MFAIIGEALIDLVIKDNNTLKSYVGGGPLNTAIALARLGEKVYYHFPLSNDFYGAKTYDFLQENNVVYSYPIVSDLPTTLAISSVDKDKKSKYQFYREHTAQRDLDSKLLLDIFKKDIICIHTGTLAIADTPDIKVIATVLKYARKHNIIVSIDPNVRPNITKNRQAYIHNLFTAMEFADIIKLSDDDLYYLYPTSTLAQAVHTMMTQFKHCNLLVVTQAHHPILAYTKYFSLSYQPQTLIDIGDTIGAGDCFIAGLLHGLHQKRILNIQTLHTLSKQDIHNVLALANQVAQHNCKSHGCNPPYKDHLTS